MTKKMTDAEMLDLYDRANRAGFEAASAMTPRTISAASPLAARVTSTCRITITSCILSLTGFATRA